MPPELKRICWGEGVSMKCVQYWILLVGCERNPYNCYPFHCFLSTSQKMLIFADFKISWVAFFNLGNIDPAITVSQEINKKVCKTVIRECSKASFCMLYHCHTMMTIRIRKNIYCGRYLQLVKVEYMYICICIYKHIPSSCIVCADNIE